MDNYEQIPGCGNYEDATQAEWANEQLLAQEYDEQTALVACRNLATHPKKYVRTAAAILVAQLEKANNEVHNGHQSTQQAAISF